MSVYRRELSFIEGLSEVMYMSVYRRELSFIERFVGGYVYECV